MRFGRHRAVNDKYYSIFRVGFVAPIESNKWYNIFMKIIVLLFLLCASFGMEAEPLVFSISNDHTNLLYTCQAYAHFYVTVKTAGGETPTNGIVHAKLDNFGSTVFSTEDWSLAETNTFSLTGRLSEPGFLRLTLTAEGTPEKVWSVGYEPEKIRKGSPSPTDFDEFWAAAKKRIAEEIPLDLQLKRLETFCTSKYDFYQLSVATYGRRVYGLMSVPKESGRYPVNFGISAAGFGQWTNTVETRPHTVCVQMSVYPFAMDPNWKSNRTEEELYNPFQGEMRKRYGTECWQAGLAKSREDYFYYPVILAYDRIVDWLLDQPYVDPARLRYQGTSQGGGLGLMLTALNPHFACAAFYVPALTDVLGCLKGRNSGWPFLIESYETAEAKEAVRNFAPYFDAANFASRITCPVRFAVGFADTTCSPAAVYATFNELRVSDKVIRAGFGMTHGCFSEFYREWGDWTLGF